MIIGLVIYLFIGCMTGVWYARECAKTDETHRDFLETSIGATVLIIGWPVAAVIAAWRAWE